jgi:acyl-CoA oxidase
MLCFAELTAEDILDVSQKYWEFHTDPILTMDGSVGTLLTIHYNLVAGTLAMFARGRPDVQRTLQRMLSFQTSCVLKSYQ